MILKRSVAGAFQKGGRVEGKKERRNKEKERKEREREGWREVGSFNIVVTFQF